MRKPRRSGARNTASFSPSSGADDLPGRVSKARIYLMGLLLKSLSRVDSLKSAAAIEPGENPHDRATIHESPRGNMTPAATAVPLESEASTVSLAIRPRDPATPLEIDTSTICLAISSGEPPAAIRRDPATPLEIDTSTVCLAIPSGEPPAAIRPRDPATPLETDTSTICLTIPADEPPAPFTDLPISLEALFAAPFPSEATDATPRPTAPAISLAPPSQPPTSPQIALSNLATALDRLEQLQQALAEDGTHPEATVHGPPSPNTPQSTTPPKLRPEFRELCDHLLSRFPLTKHCTLLVVDAGRAPLDHTWLLPLVAGLLDSIADRHPRALLVEVDPGASGIAQMLGIDATLHSADGTSDTAAFSNTYHPQIDILRLSAGCLAAGTTRLEETWPDLQESYNLILVASGPFTDDTSGRDSNPPNQIARSILPLADAVILSVELSNTPVSVASQTAELLKAAGANLLGCTVQAASVTG
jgi:hypothetical protein